MRPSRKAQALSGLWPMPDSEPRLRAGNPASRRAPCRQVRLHRRVRPVLIIEVDRLHPHSFEAVFQRAAKGGWGGVRDDLMIVAPIDAAFGCNGDPIPDRAEGFSHQLFIDGGGTVGVEAHIGFRRIKKSIPFFKCLMDAPNGHALFQRHAVGMGKPHASKSECGYGQFVSQLTRLHVNSPFQSFTSPRAFKKLFGTQGPESVVLRARGDSFMPSGMRSPCFSLGRRRLFLGVIFAREWSLFPFFEEEGRYAACHGRPVPCRAATFPDDRRFLDCSHPQRQRAYFRGCPFWAVPPA